MDNSFSRQISQLIDNMGSISLKEMDHVKLMHRRDTKFVLPASKIPGIIEQIQHEYRVLEIDGERKHDYHTTYYDTPIHEMYMHHHASKLNRYKIRIRKYLSSDTSFLEIKFKNNKRETIKNRIKYNNSEGILDKVPDRFIKSNSPYVMDEIEPALQNNFSRITLVHRSIPERITIDTDLKFIDIHGVEMVDLPNISIIEVKQERDYNRSEMIDVLRANHIQPMGFSKYCIGTVLIKPEVKNNLFKTRIRRIKKFNEPVLSN